MSDDALKDLRMLLVVPETITVAGTDVTLRPFEFRHLERVLTLVESAKSVMKIGADALSLDLLRLLTDQYEVAVELMTILGRQPREFVEGLAIDEALFLLGACIRVNADFFIQKLSPLVMLAITSQAPSAFVSAHTPPPDSEAATAAPDGATSSPG